MSAEPGAALEMLAADADELKARQAAETMVAGRNVRLGDLLNAVSQAVSARQSEAAMILLGGAERFINSADEALVDHLIPELTMLLGTCWREKMNDPARRVIEFALALLAKPPYTGSYILAPVVMDFAQRAGRFALLRREDALFGEITAQSASWLAHACSGQSTALITPVMEHWLHRIVKHQRVASVPAIFAVLRELMDVEIDKTAFLEKFLLEWRFAVSTAGLKPGNPLAVELMEHLFLFALQSSNKLFWPIVIRFAGDAATDAIIRQGARDGFFMARPLLDVGRVMLGDELKFGSGAEPDSMRQMVIRLICLQVLRMANLASRGDMLAVAGDKIEEMYKSWILLPGYEPHRRSICRFFQMLLIVWAHRFRRAAKKWVPRERELSEPLLLTEEDQVKLVFLL